MNRKSSVLRFVLLSFGGRLVERLRFCAFVQTSEYHSGWLC